MSTRALGSFALRILAASVLTVASFACGIREHWHSKPPSEGSDDFARDFANDFGPTSTVDTAPEHTESNVDAGQDTVSAAMIQDAGAADSGSEMRPDREVATKPPAAAGGTGGSQGRSEAADGAASDAHSEAGSGGKMAPSDEPVGPPPPPAMPDIVLGDVPLRKEDVLAFIHFGHSNMSGQATDPPELRPYFFTETHPRVWMYHVGTPPVLATEPTAREDRDQTAGPGIALLKQAAELAPSKYFVSLGYSHGGASCIHFTPGWPYWDELIKSAVAIKDHVTFAAIVVMLGNIESNGDGATAITLPDCFVTLADSVREAVGVPDLPLLFSGYEVEASGQYAVDKIGPQKVIAELAKVTGVVSNSALVSAVGIPMQDDHHFNLTGHMIWTKRVLDIMQAKGWFPWGTKPTMQASP